MTMLLASLLSPSPLPTTTSSSSTLPKAVRLAPAKPLATTLAAVAAAGLLVLSPVALAAAGEPEFKVYYGTAASAANYGGYGGNASKKDAAEYVYEVPEGWKERLVSKVEKGTNGTDSEFFNPRKRSEREYLTFLAGFRACSTTSRSPTSTCRTRSRRRTTCGRRSAPTGAGRCTTTTRSPAPARTASSP